MTDDYAQRRQKKEFSNFARYQNLKILFLSPCSAVCFTQHLPYPHPLTSHTPVSHQILSIGMSFYRRSRTTVYVCPVRTLFIGQTGDIAQFLRWIAVSMDKLLNIASLSSCYLFQVGKPQCILGYQTVSPSFGTPQCVFLYQPLSQASLVPQEPIFCTNCCPVSIWYLRNSFPARNANYVQTTVLCSNLIFTL